MATAQGYLELESRARGAPVARGRSVFSAGLPWTDSVQAATAQLAEKQLVHTVATVRGYLEPKPRVCGLPVDCGRSGFSFGVDFVQKMGRWYTGFGYTNCNF